MCTILHLDGTEFLELLTTCKIRGVILIMYINLCTIFMLLRLRNITHIYKKVVQF